MEVNTKKPVETDMDKKKRKYSGLRWMLGHIR